MNNHPLLLADQLSAQFATHAATQSPAWLQAIQATGGIATTVGVLTALYIAAIREPRKDAAERREHMAQLNALHNAEKDRIAAQSRKVLPTCARTPMFGDSWWTVKIDNASNAEVTILSVDIAALDAKGAEVPNGCRPASNTMSVEDAFDRSVRAALADMSRDGFEHQLVPTFRHTVHEALIGHIVNQWPRRLPPSQHAVMAYTTAHPSYTVRVTIGYEDSAGYQWVRTDTSQPRRAEEDPR
jgi:hypothetical protein